MSQKTLICDLDGTLVNTWNWLHDPAVYTVEQLNLKIPEEGLTGLLRKGRPLAEFYEICTEGLHVSVEECIAMHIEYQQQPEVLSRVTPYHGVVPTLRVLSEEGVQLGIATSRILRNQVIELLHKFGMNQFFGTIVTLGEVKRAKPDPESIFLAMANLDAEPEDTFFVGDTSSDMRAGIAADVTTIGVTYGFDGEDLRDEDADHFIKRFSEIIPIVLGEK